MPETTPASQPDQKKPQPQRNLVSKAHGEMVSKTDKLIATAKKAAYAPTLAEREIDDAFVSALAAKCDAARELMGHAVDKTTDKTGATKAETAAKTVLVGLVREVQRAAKQKYADEKPEELKDYGVGGRIDQNRASLEQAAAGFLTKLKTNALPGITPAKVKALEDALKAYKDTDAGQAGAQADATGKRRSLDDMIAGINKDRRKILFAVEAAWPYTNKANAPIRSEFGLSPDRPYNG